jgi:C-terminal processing protease CtpA/Prc
LENLVVFSRLFGYIRYFHPSDQTAVAEWEKLALAGVQAAERAGGAEELALILEDFFCPVAPTVRVFPAGRRPALPAELAPLPGVAKFETTFWEHLGVGLQSSPPYRSQRISNPPSPAPGEPFVVDLGGGVSALVPLVLYKDVQGTLPHVSPDFRPSAPAKPEGFVPSGDDRATRLADVVLAWNVFQHFYPYFDVVQADWPSELRRALSAAATDRDSQAFLGTLRRLVAALHDGHGGVYHASEDRSYRLPLLWDWVEDQLAVTRIAPQGAAGLRPGDVVVAIDGRPAREVLAAREELISGATPRWRRWRALHEIAAGKGGEPVRLVGRHPGGEAFAVTLPRSLPTFGAGSLEETRPAKIAAVRPGIFYVDLSRISDQDFEGALDRLAAARGIVFDLRGHPSNLSPIVIAHLIDRPVTSPRWHIPVVTRPDRQDWEWETSAGPIHPQSPRLQARAAFLADGRTISYAETYLGMVEHYRLAEIVGGPTAGTNGDINSFVLPGGYQVIWTGLKVLKHDGSQHHGVGIQPTVPVSRTLEGVAEGRDELLEKAIEVVSP